MSQLLLDDPVFSGRNLYMYMIDNLIIINSILNRTGVIFTIALRLSSQCVIVWSADDTIQYEPNNTGAGEGNRHTPPPLHRPT